MTKLKVNIIANFAGSGWSALANVVFIPVYIHFIGIEAYGLIGFYATLQGLCAVLDMGLSATINRELARLSVSSENKQEMCELARTLELLYWGMALVIMLAVVLAAPLIADNWLNGKGLGRDTVLQSIILMGVGLFFRWPLSFYFGGLMGLQRQVAFNTVKVIAETVRNAGVILALWLIAPTIQVFFLWQIFVGFGYTCLLIVILWKSLGSGILSTRFNPAILHDIKNFAVGMSGISLTVVALTQMDKVILSKVLSLKDFGYYSLASTIAIGLYQIISPVFYAIYPRLTQLTAMGDNSELIRMYHAGSQLLSLLLLPVSACIVLFSRELLLLWTRSVVTADNSYLLLSILMAGTALNGLMNMPYAIQLAHGSTRLTLLTNIVAILLMVPIVLIMSLRSGAIGAAAAWLALNFGYVMIVPHIMHRSILIGEKWRWYWGDIMKPLMVSTTITLLARFLMPSFVSSLVTMVVLISLVFLTFLLAALSLSSIRVWLLDRYTALRCA